MPTLAFQAARAGETPGDALVRLKASREAELFLMAKPVQDKVIHRVELVLSTLEGEEERILVKPLEQDPLGALAVRINHLPLIQRPGLGATLLDVPGQPGPWVLAASEACLKAGLQPGRPIIKAQGKVVGTVLELQELLGTAKGPISVDQGGGIMNLPVQMEGLEIPLGASDLCYPALLAHLRLLQAGTKGEEATLIKLNVALALMQFRKYDKAIELLRDARLSIGRGVSQGTLDFHTGRCFIHLGASYQSEAVQAFRQALKYPQATLQGPDGPLVAPMARQALEDLK